MAIIRIEIKGMNESLKYLNKLSPNIDIHVSKASEQFMKDVKKSAKLRAPRDTLRTAKSIDILPPKNSGNKKVWKLTVNSPGAYWQEVGFKPHFVYSKNGYINNSTVKSKKFWADGFHWVSKNKPFIAPAVEKNLSNLSQKLNNATKKALRMKK